MPLAPFRRAAAPLLAAALLAACAPLDDLRRLADPARTPTNAAVEVAVKANHGSVIQDILAGGGPALAAAYDAGRVPAGDRAARTLQLQGNIALYNDNPGALALAISSFGA
ncbi:hypothetical protein [Wenxinia saemankumensis]|uniref:Uncharacterized protein n=1 Tax=Wenxinia saemankumensis TaxID=1447782 RepID=A0A1M6HJE9_9RHOB|nr:hypothetical protein [Wenxinia saemankumensis]SHJ22340.1 hypothetical protein SAMN05444417_3261 [Wenxinia saemankumensis]